jgi:hypothetical protein
VPGCRISCLALWAIASCFTAILAQEIHRWVRIAICACGTWTVSLIGCGRTVASLSMRGIQAH